MTAHAQWPWLSLNEGSDIESDVIFERAIGPRLDILLFMNCTKSSYENKRLSLLKVSYLLNASSGTPKIKQPPRGLSDPILMLGCLEYIFYSFPHRFQTGVFLHCLAKNIVFLVQDACLGTLNYFLNGRRTPHTPALHTVYSHKKMSILIIMRTLLWLYCYSVFIAVRGSLWDVS